MRALRLLTLAALAGCSLPRPIPPSPEGVQIGDAQALEIGRRIYMNEAGGKPELLVHWNVGEEFASLGIGHFLWYPRGYRGPFTESFPKLLAYLQLQGVVLPAWLRGAPPPCPWNSRQEFLAERDPPSARVLELRQLLTDTVAHQARFAALRLEEALPKLTAGLPALQAEQVRIQFRRLSRSPEGLYALMDYVNFKGEGVSPTERYQGEGWGLLQVLEGMAGQGMISLDSGRPAVEEFVRSAKAVLARRVANSPPARDEKRWLPIWGRRLDTYLLPTGR